MTIEIVAGLRRLCGVLAAVLILVAGACATGGASASGGNVAIEVQNNLVPPTSLSIYAVPETGSRQLVGIVQPSSTRVLQFDPPGTSGRYTFVAETTEGNDIASNPINVTTGDRLRFDVQSQLVTSIQ